MKCKLILHRHPPRQCGDLGHSSPAGVPAIPEQSPQHGQDDHQRDGGRRIDASQDGISSAPVAVLEEAEKRSHRLLDGRAVEVDMNAFVSDGELKRHGLVGLRHVGFLASSLE